MNTKSKVACGIFAGFLLGSFVQVTYDKKILTKFVRRNNIVDNYLERLNLVLNDLHNRVGIPEDIVRSIHEESDFLNIAWNEV